MHELSEVDVFTFAEIKDRNKSFTYDPWQVCIGQEGDSVDSFFFVVTLRHEVLIDILEIRNGHIFLKFFVVQDGFIYEFDSVCL